MWWTPSDCWERLQRGSSITVPWIRALCKRRYWFIRRGKGGQQWVMSERTMKKLLCCVCRSPPECVWAISGPLISKNIVVRFQSQTLWGLLPSSTGRMEQEADCRIKLSWYMWVSVKEEWGRNVWERVNRRHRWGEWWGSLLFQLCGKECCSDVTVAGGSLPSDDTIPRPPRSAPRQPKSSLNSLNFFTASAAWPLILLTNITVEDFFTPWFGWATMEKRTKGSGGKVTGRNRKSSAQLHVDKKVDVDFLTVNICGGGKTTSCRETLPKCSSSVSKISGLLWATVKGIDFKKCLGGTEAEMSWRSGPRRTKPTSQNKWLRRLTVAWPHVTCVSDKKLHLNTPQRLQPTAN